MRPREVLTVGSAGRPVVVFLGDSITAGEVSSDWVSLIGGAHPDWRCENAGVNGDLAWNLRQRVSTALRGNPCVVVVLVGTNDVACEASPALLERLKRTQRLPREFDPSETTFIENVRAIMREIRATSTARVIVVEIPPLGEDVDSVVNRRVSEYNAALHRLAEGERVVCLPLFERLVAELPEGHRPQPYSYRKAPMLLARFQRSILGRSWDEISRRNGLVVLTDWVHLNDLGAAILADLVTGEVERSLP